MGIEKACDIDEFVIKGFFEEAIEPLSGNCYLRSYPPLITSMYPNDKRQVFCGLTEKDIEFFKQQIDQHDSLLWEAIIERERLLDTNAISSLSKPDTKASKSWLRFYQTYGSYYF